MVRYIGSRENALDDALSLTERGASRAGTRRYFHVVDHDQHPDTEVLVESVDGGVNVVLPDYTHHDARTVVENPSPTHIKQAALTLVEEHTLARI
jgi:hypothetical protein